MKVTSITYIYILNVTFEYQFIFSMIIYNNFVLPSHKTMSLSMFTICETIYNYMSVSCAPTYKTPLKDSIEHRNNRRLHCHASAKLDDM